MGWGLLSATLPPLGLIAFTAYVHRVVHETRSSLGVQALWGYRIVTPWHAIAASWSYINHPFIPGQAPIELLNLGCLLGFALLAVLALWRLPLGYALYAWPYLGLLFMREMGYTPLMSVARFTLVLFPCFIVLAMFLARRPWLANTWLISSILLQALLLSCYVHFEFVG